jgi:hypothetical protein
MSVQPIPANAVEAAKRDRGEIWVSMDGGGYRTWVPPQEQHKFVRLDGVRGSLVGRRLIRLLDGPASEFIYSRGWYAVGEAQRGALLPGAPLADQSYVPVVSEQDYWGQQLLGAKINPQWANVLRVWLDESEDPAPR